ncbi:MAG: NgoFVII family restriction endonuclease [Candidatus Saganbacteria bacterium]|nr:NgoFVII family restriction endonuclease [Candidatus Saganbacteria bacterium]
MITTNLFDEILLKPATENPFDELCIVSAYATGAMAFSHLNKLSEKGSNIKISLIVGMSASDGVSKSNHRSFQELMLKTYPKNFECSYLFKAPPVHSKIYVWKSAGRPSLSFLGSANYTQNAFSLNQREAMAPCDPNIANDYFVKLIDQAIYCTHQDSEALISIYKDKIFRRFSKGKEPPGVVDKQGPRSNYVGLPHIKISLLDNSGELPSRSGLNWGQRPEEGREPNQAYIRLPSEVYRSDFFPERPTQFTVLTDDNKVLICSRAQDNGKAIHTPHNNSLIGEYFRNRLGLKSGALINLTDLQKYGRSDIDFYKIDDETYYMDFAVNG